MTRARGWDRFRRSRSGVAGLVLVGAIAVAALVGPALDSHRPDLKDVARGTDELGAPRPPSLEYPLGTDALGRCVAARVLGAARRSLVIGVVAAGLALLVGLGVGLAAGYRGGWLDRALMRGVDVVLAFPLLLLVVAIAALARDTGAPATVLLLGAVSWTTIARVVRGKVMALRDADFVAGARASGGSPARIVARHILPNVLGPVLVLAVIAVAQLILVESTLAYVGLGAPPPSATWGTMLSEGQAFMQGAPWLVTAPGIAIAATVLAWNLLGEGLRGALDPR